MQIGNVFMSNRLSLFASDGTRDLQTGRQRDDDGYSHNDIPGLIQKKWIIKSPTGVRDIVLVLFTTAKHFYVYNANMSRRDKWNYKFAQQKRF
jgi:hypothetical protein